MTKNKIDQLHLSDRILQNLLLQQLKPTFSHVMNPNCYHLHGPSGVRLATQHIREVVSLEKPKYIIRADIKSYYKSISHHLLIEDVKRYYLAHKVQSMLEEIIKNPLKHHVVIKTLIMVLRFAVHYLNFLVHFILSHWMTHSIQWMLLI